MWSAKHHFDRILLHPDSAINLDGGRGALLALEGGGGDFASEKNRKSYLMMNRWLLEKPRKQGPHMGEVVLRLLRPAARRVTGGGEAPVRLFFPLLCASVLLSRSGMILDFRWGLIANLNNQMTWRIFLDVSDLERFFFRMRVSNLFLSSEVPEQKKRLNEEIPSLMD